MTYSLAVDIGGTFTDIVLRKDTGEMFVDKTLSTHHDLLEGFFRGVDAVLAKAALTPADIDGVVVHATTIVTNALIERKGPKTALLVTEGFRDVLTIRNEHRYDMFDLQIEFADPLIPRELTFGIAERVLADGTLLHAVDAAQVARIGRDLAAQQVASVAVCLLNSFRNPGERTTGGRDPARRGAGSLRDAVVGRLAANSGISAGVDHGGECLYGADHRAVSARFGRAAGGRTCAEPAAHHAEFRRRDRRGHRRALSGADDRERSGGRRPGRELFRRVAAARPAVVVRYGRHDGEGVPDRTAPAAGDRQL